MRLSIIVTIRLNRENDSIVENLSRMANEFPSEDVELIYVETFDPVDSITVPEAPVHVRLYNQPPWNQPVAKNYGLRLAKGQNVLLLDADHSISCDMVSFAANKDVRLSEAYLLPRSPDYNDTIAKSHHPGSILFKRRNIFFDERFSGYYGYDDKWFNARFEQLLILPNWNFDVAFPIEGGMHGFERDTIRNHKLFMDLIANEYPVDSRSSFYLSD